MSLCVWLSNQSATNADPIARTNSFSFNALDCPSTATLPSSARVPCICLLFSERLTCCCCSCQSLLRGCFSKRGERGRGPLFLFAGKHECRCDSHPADAKLLVFASLRLSRLHRRRRSPRGVSLSDARRWSFLSDLQVCYRVALVTLFTGFQDRDFEKRQSSAPLKDGRWILEPRTRYSGLTSSAAAARKRDP